MSDDDLQQEPGASAAAIAAGGGSVLERAKRNRSARDLDHHWFDIPSWDGELKAQYQVLEREDIERMIRRARQRAAQQSNSRGNAAGQKSESSVQGTVEDLNFLIKACVGIKAVDAVTEEEEELPVGGYSDWQALKDLLRVPNPETDEEKEAMEKLDSVASAQDITAFITGYNSIAVAAHAAKLARWMQDTSRVEDPT